MFLKKEKESRVKHQSAFEQLRPVTHASKTKCSIYTSDAGQCLLWLKALDTEPYDISFENILKMIHSLNRGFAVRNPYVQNMP